MDIDWTVPDTSAANAAITVTKAAQASTRHSIMLVIASFSAAAVGLLTVKKGADVWFERYVHNAAEIEIPGGGVRGDSNEDVSATLAAGGAGIVGKLAIAGTSR